MVGSSEPEIELEGGNTHSSIVRVGATVRRPTGPWTPAVHALLRHLETVGFPGVPRVLGIDEQDREILTYAEGTVVWPEHFDLVQTPEALDAIAHRIRSYHDAVASFRIDPAQVWSDRGRDPTGATEVLCHNDLAPWNLVRAKDGWTFIDWDLAAPGRRTWDLGWALHTLVPLWPESGLNDEHLVRRVRRFCSAYGDERLGPELIDMALVRCRHEVELIRDRGTRGEAPYVTLLSEGHDTSWEAAAAHIERKGETWKRLLRSNARDPSP